MWPIHNDDVRSGAGRAARLFHVYNQLLNLKRQLIGLALGPPAAVGETLVHAVEIVCKLSVD